MEIGSLLSFQSEPKPSPLYW